MSKIVDIKAQLIDLIETNLTGYLRLPNPYSVTENTYLHLSKGYGLFVGPGFDTERYTGCIVTWERDFTLILVNQMTATDNDTLKRESIENALLEDHDIMRKIIYKESPLGGIAIKSTVVNDQGINFIDADQLKFLSLQMTITVEYQDIL